MVNISERGGQHQRIQDYNLFIDPDKKLLREIGSDMSLIKAHIERAKEEYKDHAQMMDQLKTAERKLEKAGTYEDFEKVYNDINKIVNKAKKGGIAHEDLVLLSSLRVKFENKLIALHQAGIIYPRSGKTLDVLKDKKTDNFTLLRGSKAAIAYANRTANLAISQKDPHSPNYGRTFQTTTEIRNRVFGYASTNPKIFSDIRQYEDLVEDVDTSKWLTLNKIAQELIQDATPVVAKQAKRKAKKLDTKNPVEVAATLMGLSILGESAGSLLALPQPKHPLAPHPKPMPSRSEVDAILNLTHPTEFSPISGFTPALGGTPSSYINPYFWSGAAEARSNRGYASHHTWRDEINPTSGGTPSWYIHRLNTMPENAYYATSGPMSTPSITGLQRHVANRNYKGASRLVLDDYGYATELAKPDEKTKRNLLKSLELLYRPVINLVKGLGDIAAESKKMELAMASLASALGNPFSEGTLSAISDFGSAGANTAIGGAGAIGGAISGVGGGIGRMANDTWNLRGKGLTDAQNKGLSKAGGVLAAVSAALGIIGAAISAVAGVVSAGFGISTSLLKSLNKITLRILGTSPILETIKNILNLAFTMAFLPAMTLLEGKMLPIFLNLLNTMVKFGSSFTDDFVKFVPGIVDSFSGVVKYIVEFFRNNSPQLAEMVADMIKLLPDMMKMQLGIIELFVNNKDKILRLADVTIDALSTFIDQGLLDALLKFATMTMEFLSEHGVDMAKSVISLAEYIIGGAKWGSELKENIMKTGFGVDSSGRMYSDLMEESARSGDILGYFSNMGKGLANVLTLGQVHLATGGYVPATPGGVPAIIGEGGEGEYIIPESKLHSIGGLTVVFSGNVYGMNDFKQQVRSIMNEYTTKANFR